MSFYRVFKSDFFTKKSDDAVQSARQRSHFNMHSSYEDLVQRTYICLLNGTYIPPHYHKYEYQRELFVLLSGQVKFVFFDRQGKVTDILILSAGEMIEVEPFAIHTVHTLSEKADVLEVKQGPFVAEESKVFLEWTIPENDPRVSNYLTWLDSVAVGDIFN